MSVCARLRDKESVRSWAQEQAKHEYAVLPVQKCCALAGVISFHLNLFISVSIKHSFRYYFFLSSSLRRAVSVCATPPLTLLPPKKNPKPAQVPVVFSQNRISSEMVSTPFPLKTGIEGSFCCQHSVMKDMILTLTLWLAAWAAVSHCRGHQGAGRCQLFPAKCYALGLRCTGVLLAAKHIFSCSWSFYSEKLNARKFCTFYLIFLPFVLFFWDSLNFTGVTSWCWYMWGIGFCDQRRTKK